MEGIITHSPTQVRPGQNITHERLLSMLSAESANQLPESLGDQDRIRLDVWNTYLKHPAYGTLSPESRDKLVGEFNRASNAVDMYTDGSGFGLYVAKEIIDAHEGGKIVMNSKEGEGTEFVVLLKRVI